MKPSAQRMLFEPIAENLAKATSVRKVFFFAGEAIAARSETRHASGKGTASPRRLTIANFMFATGIENSIPTINHGKTRIDEMAVCGHYERWREDFDCVAEIGINYLRYGPPIHKTYLGPNKFDWEFAD